jgi:hypothetical protein
MLFAQVALAAAACDWPGLAPARAFAAQAGEASCHEGPARSANLCLAHCLSGDQTVDIPQVTLPARVAAVLVVDAIGPSRACDAFTRRPPDRPGAPPPRILFQSFLI